MVAVKAYQADAFLKAVERVPPGVLFFGSDAASGPGNSSGNSVTTVACHACDVAASDTDFLPLAISLRD